MRGISLKWIKSYLSNRAQYVCLESEKSHTLSIQCGVPQGSILGPLLFILYINDIVNVSEIMQLILFADDTNIFMSDKSLSVLNCRVNSELCKISKWFRNNKLSLNVKKTNFMLFTSAKSRTLHEPFTIKIDGRNVEQVTETKFLGVIITENLTWDKHIKTIRNKVSKAIGVICKNP